MSTVNCFGISVLPCDVVMLERAKGATYLSCCLMPILAGSLSQYNSPKSDVTDALKLYAACVSDSDGHDDCSSEFSSLRSAQDDFESAVSEYESNCG